MYIVQLVQFRGSDQAFTRFTRSRVYSQDHYPKRRKKEECSSMTIAPFFDPQTMIDAGQVIHVDCSTLKSKCPGAIYSRGMCHPHYARWRRRFEQNFDNLVANETNRAKFPTSTELEAEAVRLTYYSMNWRPVGEYKQRTCEEDGCMSKHYALSLCQKHYRRMLRYGRLE